PIHDAVGRGLFDEEIRRRLRRFEESLQDAVAPAQAVEQAVELAGGQGGEKLELFGIPAENPRLPSGPSRRRRVALLGAGAAVSAVVEVEDRFVSDSSAHVVGVATLAEVDVEARRRFSMSQQAPEQ